MNIIELMPQENGAHRNQTCNGALPVGWALLPDSAETPNFPFGTVEAAEIDGKMTVTEWNALPIPPNAEAPETPSQLDRIEAQLIYTAMMTDTLLRENGE